MYSDHEIWHLKMLLKLCRWIWNDTLLFWHLPSSSWSWAINFRFSSYESQKYLSVNNHCIWKFLCGLPYSLCVLNAKCLSVNDHFIVNSLCIPNQSRMRISPRTILKIIILYNFILEVSLLTALFTVYTECKMFKCQWSLSSNDCCL